MIGTQQYSERIEIDYRSLDNEIFTIGIDICRSDLAEKWLQNLIDTIKKNLHLEKNYCFLGWAHSARDGKYICQEINRVISGINQANIGYQIQDQFELDTLLLKGPINSGLGQNLPGLRVDQERFNRLHRYFEDLQGVSGNPSPYYLRADANTRWYIRQLNLLCHEFESWALSFRKSIEAPEWQRPSQLMCWLNAPRFALNEKDFAHFGIDSIYRDLGGVYLGVNKAVGKHHWEVFQDEGRDSRIHELTTTTLKSQTEAASDFDIEWARDTRGRPWMKETLDSFRDWLKINGFDPDDPALTIGHPKIGQVDLTCFSDREPETVWKKLYDFLDVYKIRVAGIEATYPYRWADIDYQSQQVDVLKSGN